MTSWLKGFSVACAGLAVILNLPTRLWLPAERATLSYLATTTLRTTDQTKRTFLEAVELSSLKETFDTHGVRLYAVVHQTLGVEDFRSFFKGEIFLDEERRFYGPKERWMFLSGFVRPTVWMSFFRAANKGMSGNIDGEGRLLGGLFTIGPGNQGILMEQRESEFGDHANLSEIIKAVALVKPAAEL